MPSTMAVETTEHTSFFSKVSFLGLVALVVLGGVFYMAGKNIEAGKINTPGTLTVTGDAKAYATPNLAEINIGVQIERQQSASEAMNMLKDRMNSVIAAIKQMGIIDSSIRTSGMSLGPSYDYTNGNQSLEGYIASQMLTIKTKLIDKVGDILNAATDAGANQAGDVRFIVENPDMKKDEVRKIAVTEAQKKAQEMAAQLGVVLGSLKSYEENPGTTQPPVYMRAPTVAADGGSLPIPSGEQEVSMTVTLTYEVK